MPGAMLRSISIALVVSCLLTAGCATTPVGRSSLELATEVDREQYGIGDPVVVTVWLQNLGRRTITVPRFDKNVLRFLYAARDSGVQIEREPVSSKSVAPVPVELGPNESMDRRFLFTRMTTREGEYALLVTFKGAVTDSGWMEPAVHAGDAFFIVAAPVSLERDPANGMILKKQAIKLAEAEAKGKVTASRAVLEPLKDSQNRDTGLYTWVVLLRAESAGGSEQEYAVQVNAYTGRVTPLELSLGSGEDPAP